MKTLLIGAALVGAAGVAVAQSPAPAAPPVTRAPEMAGLPGDRVQTRTDVVERVRKHFARLDANRDGAIARDEMAAMRGQHMRGAGAPRAPRGDRLAMRDPAAAFDRLDANKDGAISRDEFASVREMRGERRGAPGAAAPHGQHMGGNVYMHRMGRGGHGMGGGRMMMRMADANNDGRITLQEAEASALQHFDRVDANRDGRITPDERQQMRQQRIEMRRRG